MALWLTLDTPSGHRCDVAVEADGSCPIGQILDSLAGHLGRGNGRGVVQARNHRSACWLDRTRTLAEEDLLHGDHLSLDARTATPQPIASVRETSRTPGVPVAHELFNRPPRVLPPVASTELTVAAPPEVPRGRRFPLGVAIVPLVMGVGLWAVTGYAQVLLFALFSPLMALWSFFDDRFSGRHDFADKRKEFFDSVTSAREQLTERTAAERETLRRLFPGPAEVAVRAIDRAPELWERRPVDPDFLQLRVGTVTRAAATSVAIEDGGSPALRAEATRWLAGLEELESVPATVACPAAGVLGVSGTVTDTSSLGRWLLAQVAAQHSPAEVVIAAALPVGCESEWDWLRWLPHTSPTNSPLDGPHLAAGAPAARDLFTRLGALLQTRRDMSGQSLSGRAGALPYIVTLIDERLAVERLLLSELLADGPAHGLFFVWLGADARGLPGECRSVVSVDDTTHTASVTRAAAGVTDSAIVVDELELADAERIARAICPLVDIGARRVQGRLPARVSLVDVLDLTTMNEADVKRSWSHADEGIRAVIGTGLDGPVSIDLGEDPHALMGGTTGSGKSELLQTMIASLALAYSPQRVAFVLVDYKGGAAFKDVIALPHAAGLVTDLDPHLTRRALSSLDAEIKKRELLMRTHGVQDLGELQRLDSRIAPPHMLIVVDEFATLAKELPEFVTGVVDIAQRGRTLGLHIVLATQRPAGVVNDNIRANVTLRVALRVTDDADSNDVIGVPDAARFPRTIPGRGLVRFEKTAVTEFQAAYVGGSSFGSTRAEVSVSALEFDGASAGPRASGGSTRSDLVEIVEACAAAARALHLPPTDSPWLPPLPDVLPTSAIGDPVPSHHVVRLGLLDEPDHQRQRVLDLDLERQSNVLVYGTSRSGKTTLLRTIACGLAEQCSPDEFWFYALDFGSRGLSALDALPHCGGVVADADPARSSRLFAMLRREIERRKEQFERLGVSSIEELRQKGGHPVARIVLFLDGYAGFASAFERLDFGRLLDALPRVVSDGPSVGVHVIITADRRAAVPGALSGAISTRIVLRVADLDEFASLGVDLDVVRGARVPPGRGFVRGTLEFQARILGEDPSASGQNEAVADIARALDARWHGMHAPVITVLPVEVARTQMDPPKEQWQAVIGLNDDDLAPAYVDLDEGHFLVAGPQRSGKSTTLATLAQSLREVMPDVEFRLFAPRPTPLEDLTMWTSVARGDSCEQEATSLQEVVDARLVDAQHRPVVVVIDDAEELGDDGSRALESVARRGRDRNVRVLAASEIRSAHHAFGGLLSELKRAKRGVLLQPELEVDGDLFGVRLPRPADTARPPGRGFLVAHGATELIQVAHS